jgi:hypothetical protein
MTMASKDSNFYSSRRQNIVVRNPKFATTFDLMTRRNVFSIEVDDVKISIPEEEMKRGLTEWKKQSKDLATATTKL